MPSNVQTVLRDTSAEAMTQIGKALMHYKEIRPVVTNGSGSLSDQLAAPDGIKRSSPWLLTTEQQHLAHAWSTASALWLAVRGCTTTETGSANAQVRDICETLANLARSWSSYASHLNASPTTAKRGLAHLPAVPFARPLQPVLWGIAQAVIEQILLDRYQAEESHSTPPHLRDQFTRLCGLVDKWAAEVESYYAQWAASTSADHRLGQLEAAWIRVTRLFTAGQILQRYDLLAAADFRDKVEPPLTMTTLANKLGFDPWCLTAPSERARRMSNPEDQRALIAFWQSVRNPQDVPQLLATLAEQLHCKRVRTCTFRGHGAEVPWATKYLVRYRFDGPNGPHTPAQLVIIYARPDDDSGGVRLELLGAGQLTKPFDLLGQPAQA